LERVSVAAAVNPL